MLDTEHMSIDYTPFAEIGRREPYVSRLTGAQKKVLLHLAQHGPKTGYDIFQKDRVISPSTWNQAILGKIDTNGGICLISRMTELCDPTEIGATHSRRRRNPYWLTSMGVTEALGLGADPRRLEDWIKALPLRVDRGFDHPKDHLLLFTRLVLAAPKDWTLRYMNEWTADGGGYLSRTFVDSIATDDKMISVVRTNPDVAQEIANALLAEAERDSDIARLLTMSTQDWRARREAMEKEAERLAESPEGILALMDKPIAHTVIMSALEKKGMNEKASQAFLQKLLKEGVIFESKSGFYRKVQGLKE